jgi:putative two-component system response regulator
MDKVLLISKVPKKWAYFVKSLSDSYEFIVSKIEEIANFPNATIIATDDIEVIGKIPTKEKKRLPIVFFGNSGDILTEMEARKQGTVDFFSIPIDEKLFLWRFKRISDTYKLMKANGDNLRWMQMIRREMVGFQEGMAEIVAQTVESRDHDTGGHIIRTATFMRFLGEEFVGKGKLSQDELDLIVRATPLHDIGKIGVRDSILLKPGPLTDDEREEMKSHSEKGASLIKKMQIRFNSHVYLRYAYDIALNHHERFDGNGYPNGKKGEEIPFCARLMSVVDVYDALVSDRVYKKGMEKGLALEIIFGGNGSQFDPEILKALNDCKELFWA